MVVAICVTNDHGYVPLVINTSRSFPHSYYFIANKTAMGLDKKKSQLMDCPLPTNNTHMLIYETHVEETK
jgi:hypothetical protein